MQFLSSLHIALTCSFVLVLTYLFFTVFSYLSSFLIRKRSSKSRRQRATTRVPRSVDGVLEWEKPATAVMDLLPEDENENEKDEDEFAHAAPDRPSVFESSDSIFDIGFTNVEHEIQRDFGGDAYDGIVEERQDAWTQAQETSKHRWHTDAVSEAGNKHLDEADAQGRSNGNTKKRQADAELQWDRQDRQEGEAKSMRNGSSSSKLDNLVGSSSGRQRLPPTWSDLEKLVNMGSNKNLLGSPQPPLAEE